MNYITKTLIKGGLRKYKKQMEKDKIDIFDLSANVELNTCYFELKKIDKETQKIEVDNFLQSEVGQEFESIAEFFKTIRIAYTNQTDTVRLLGITLDNDVIDITV